MLVQSGRRAVLPHQRRVAGDHPLAQLPGPEQGEFLVAPAHARGVFCDGHIQMAAGDQGDRRREGPLQGVTFVGDLGEHTGSGGGERRQLCLQ